MAEPALMRHLPPPGDPDAVIEGFTAHVDGLGIELYPAQEEAIFEVVLGNHVIVNTPTGSGKSMVGAAAHFAALAEGRRSVYTAPIKALVSEKFFALCRDFGSDRVGMVTGDAAVNPDAPIICCTQEILANWALRDGRRAPVDLAVVDEFHFYGDPQRGWAWQVPLLELPQTQFVLMSATLGDVGFFQRDLSERTGRETTVIKSVQRPVPLDFEYRKSSLHKSVTELLEAGHAPIYLVHFTQREATEAAQNYLALDPLTKPDKERVREALAGFRFDSPIGKDLRRFITAGVGVHHAGLLPKYRLLVEKLAQEGLLKIICGTDTLGVGVNVPIRSVLFTQLCKYDGEGVRILSNREFAQIAGRAGRKGFDDRGDVWVQAPEHVVDNLEAERKAAEKGRKKVVKKKQPDRRYAHWTEDTFEKLVNGEPEPLQSHFQVTHQMVMQLLDRPVEYDDTATDSDPDGTPIDGCAALRRLVTHNHETRKRQRGHIRRAISIYRSLVDADLLEFPPEPDEFGRRVRVNFDLQDEFALHQPLSLWAVEAIGRLDAAEAAATQAGPGDEQTGSGVEQPVSGFGGDGDEQQAGSGFGGEGEEQQAGSGVGGEGEEQQAGSGVGGDGDEQQARSDQHDTFDPLTHALNIVSIIEAVQESPGVIMAAQVNKARDELMAEMKASGVEYEERMERLAQVEAPKPNRDWTYADFDSFRAHHPWVGSDNVQPKSIAREMFERAMTFGEYVQFYGLKRSEGVVLRYLSDVYKGLVQNVPSEHRTDDLDDIEAWLGAVVRQVDSSLIDEWERMLHPDADDPPASIRPTTTAERTIVDDERAFRVMVRNTMFDWVQRLARRDHDDEIATLIAPYWLEHDEILTGPDARAGDLFDYDASTGRAAQIIADPDATNEWRVEAQIDLVESADEGRVVATVTAVSQLH